jgi:hypothetical protein
MKDLADGKEPSDEPAVWVLAPHELNSIATRGVQNVTPAIESMICAGLVDGAYWGDDWANEQAWQWEQSHDTQPDEAIHFQSGEGTYIGPPCLAVMANEANLRMLLQQGAFTVHSMAAPTLDADPRFARCVLKIVIPQESVAILTVQLEACGFRESGVYPDLDHLAVELTRLGTGVRP